MYAFDGKTTSAANVNWENDRCANRTAAVASSRVDRGRRWLPTDEAEDAVGFDPFNFIPVFSTRVRRAYSGWLVLPGVVVGLIVIAATAIEGTLGSRDDFQLVHDVRYVFGAKVGNTDPDFPLARDFPSVFLFLIVTAGVVLLHRQWQYISRGLTTLRETNVVTARKQPISNWISRAMGLDRLIGECDDYQGLDCLDRRLGAVKARTKGLLSGVVLVAGFVLATLAGNGLNRGIFRVLAPTGVSATERQEWLAQARESWWAGPEHPMGLLLFALITWFAMSLILACNVVGLATVYLAVALYFVAEPGADWYNRDGRYGWMPVARIYRTVYFCLVLLGAGISFVVILLGPQMALSVAGLIALYVLLIPVYTVIPWLVFHKVEQQARERRIKELHESMDGIDRHDLRADTAAGRGVRPLSQRADQPDPATGRVPRGVRLVRPPADRADHSADLRPGRGGTEQVAHRACLGFPPLSVS